MTSEEELLQIQDVQFSIEGLHILKGVSLNVERGETVGIIGPNGSGKTTLFNVLSGFSNPSAGRLIFQGKEISHLSAHNRAKQGMGRVFQNSGVFRDMTVRENVVTALEARQPLFANFFPWSAQSRANRERADELLSEVSLAEKATARAGSLSGGQMRLLEMIRTLAFGADLFLLDEPTAGVSPAMKGEVIALIRRLQSLGKTILVIEHDMHFIQSFCSRIVVLEAGVVALDGSPEEVRSDERLQKIYFGDQSNASSESTS